MKSEEKGTMVHEVQSLCEGIIEKTCIMLCPETSGTLCFLLSFQWFTLFLEKSSPCLVTHWQEWELPSIVKWRSKANEATPKETMCIVISYHILFVKCQNIGNLPGRKFGLHATSCRRRFRPVGLCISCSLVSLSEWFGFSICISNTHRLRRKVGDNLLSFLDYSHVGS